MGFVLLSLYVAFVSTSSMTDKNKMITYVLTGIIVLFYIISLFRG